MGARRRGPAPRPDAAARAALARVADGTATGADVDRVRSLIDECGRHGCAYDSPSHDEAAIAACPGWCRSLGRLEDARRAARGAAGRRRAAAAAGAQAWRPRLPTETEAEALAALDSGRATAMSLRVAEALCLECARMGCPPAEGDPPCPGLCARVAAGWAGWLR